MKKILLCFISLLSLFLVYSQETETDIFPSQVFESSQEFTVNNYTVEITIHEEGYFDVVENYDVNFEVDKQGIFRRIQTKYDLITEDGITEVRKIKIRNIKVPNYKFDAPFNFVQKLSDDLEIRIGDKDVTLIGPQHYEIRYRVHNAFLFEDAQIRFYWNIKPEGWDANFRQINFKIHTPPSIPLSSENCFVYSGERGNEDPSTEFKTYFEPGVFSGSSKAGFISYPGQSVTVLINLPLLSIAEEKPLWPFWDQYGWVFLIGLLVVGFYGLWLKFGKDDEVVSATSYYPPKDMDPAMAGFLIDDKSDVSDLISLIPYWGAHGYIRMEEIPKKGLFGKSDTKLIRLKPLAVGRPAYEQKMFIGLFGKAFSIAEDEYIKEARAANAMEDGQASKTTAIPPAEVTMGSLKNVFYTTMTAAQESLKEKAQPYYVAESKKVQIIIYIGLVVLGIGLAAIGLFRWGPLAMVAIVISCIVLIFINKYMIKKNAVGNQVFSELKGFRRFVKVAEGPKLKMLIRDDPGYFEKTMSYALAFGLFKKWTRKFDALHIPPPSWYRSSGMKHGSMHGFSKSFSSAMSNAQSNMVSSPKSSSSSGGGSSGGGFGGGGGGSW
ncbi:Predicted membrane protein [Arenibacter nanhaiticus]|uniref:Predicted membrane protein n=1 Tax=Arenibacter nanhaiticus TaxID=558155 RepID=A0A1M6ACK4_9FLAO|nr:DUF2207 domain-containing protein [Arenibacter nanhaiticus]SHI34222.1 Predicted membrane protein [Arenibacter nanhaiticus]